jgi:hypothetical protein
MIALSRQQVISYLIELRDLADSAIMRFGEMEAIAARWEDAVVRADATGGQDYDAMQQQISAQCRLFDTMDGFLATYARLSLLLFPVRRAGFTSARARTLCELLAVEDASPLSNRELRDCWMHHDERIDAAFERGLHLSGQQFVRSRDVTPRLRGSVLRLFEVDTLVVHFHSQSGQQLSASVREIGNSLATLERNRAGALGRMQHVDLEPD